MTLPPAAFGRPGVEQGGSDVMMQLPCPVRRSLAAGIRNSRISAVCQQQCCHVRLQRFSGLGGAVSLGVDGVMQQGQTIDVGILHVRALTQQPGQELQVQLLDGDMGPAPPQGTRIRIIRGGHRSILARRSGILSTIAPPCPYRPGHSNPAASTQQRQVPAAATMSARIDAAGSARRMNSYPCQHPECSGGVPAQDACSPAAIPARAAAAAEKIAEARVKESIKRQQASLDVETKIHTLRLDAHLAAALAEELAGAKVKRWQLKNWLTEQTGERYFCTTPSGGGQAHLPPALPAGSPSDPEKLQRTALAREVAAAIARHRAVYGLSPREFADQLGWKRSTASTDWRPASTSRQLTLCSSCAGSCASRLLPVAESSIRGYPSR